MKRENKGPNGESFKDAFSRLFGRCVMGGGGGWTVYEDKVTPPVLPFNYFAFLARPPSSAHDYFSEETMAIGKACSVLVNRFFICIDWPELKVFGWIFPPLPPGPYRSGPPNIDWLNVPTRALSNMRVQPRAHDCPSNPITLGGYQTERVVIFYPIVLRGHHVPIWFMATFDLPTATVAKEVVGIHFGAGGVGHDSIKGHLVEVKLEATSREESSGGRVFLLAMALLEEEALGLGL
ncbi:hypothetical protein QBC40DRAFT_348428 [Triangularia verruculosa]|uniref:Uncharacterized protein n=1 Tax=Triangularia verruculosa TaxID=2587418 RepID=A0AAN7AVK6_9PEZI|nr:hypothetical protein QBC40DRAFT_348428 [Triangularia verruculosa]